MRMIMMNQKRYRLII